MKQRLSIKAATVLVAIVTIVNSGLALIARAEEKPLIVRFSYAPEKIRGGDVCRIYLSVEDPEGNMKKVAFRIEETGAKRYRPTFTYLKKGMEKEFAGYFALHTATSRDLSGVELNLTLSIVDNKGNVRRDFSFPLEFSGVSAKPLPPDIEKSLNQRISIIDIDLDVPD